MLYLNPTLEREWDGKDPFEEVEKLQGRVYRSVKTRKTLQFKLNGKSYFIKIHRGAGWREIIKNLIMFKRPVLGAKNEWHALIRLKELGIDTMTPVAFGVRGRNPAKQRSFIITEELKDTVSLEDFCRDWKTHPPPFGLKMELIRMLAEVSRKMHMHGINHRDYYICHFLLSVPALKKSEVKVFLIDLHRTQIRRKVPRRWKVKDIGGLLFSAMDIELTRNDRYRFMKMYTAKPLRQTLNKDAAFWKAVEKNAKRLYSKIHHE